MTWIVVVSRMELQWLDFWDCISN